MLEGPLTRAKSGRDSGLPAGGPRGCMVIDLLEESGKMPVRHIRAPPALGACNGSVALAIDRNI